MGEKKYLMADISERLGIAPYMLRYYEEALSITIPRNERGLRYYGKQEQELFKAIINLKQKGFNLAEIKLVLNDIHRIEKLPTNKLLELRDRLDLCMSETGADALASNDEGGKREVLLTNKRQNDVGTSDLPEEKADNNKLEIFKNIMTDIVLNALRVNNEDLCHRINYTMTDSVSREFEYMLSKRDQAEEERFKQLDKRLREVCAVKDTD